MSLLHFINSSSTLPSVAGLIIGGCADLKQELVAYLDHRLAKIVVCVVDLQYGGDCGFNQAVKLTEDKLSDMKYVREQKAVSKFFEAISQDHLCCYGVQDTMFALESGTVETLLVWDRLEHVRTELKSTSSGEKKIVYSLPSQPVVESRDWEVVSSDSLLDWLLEHHKEFGSAVDFVSDLSSVGSQFVNGFGGFGAFLRFSIPLPSVSGELPDEDEDDEYEYVW